MQAERFRTLVEILDHSVEAFRGRDLLGAKKGGRWVWTTYGEFGSLVENFRGGLASLGVQRGDRVAIISNNRVEWAVAAYACYGLGAAYVPMYEAQDPKEWEFILRDCEAKVLLVANEAVLGKARGMLSISSLRHIVAIEGAPPNDSPQVTTYAALLVAGRRAARFDGVSPHLTTPPSADVPSASPERGRTSDGTSPALPERDRTPMIEPGDTADLIYTSGTTGTPKGVVLTHRNIASNVSAIHSLFSSIDHADRSLSFLPWAHSFGQTGELHLMLSMGASIAICESVDKILDNLAEVRPTILFSVPRIFTRLYTAVQLQLDSKPRPVRELVKVALAASAREHAGKRPSIPERVVRKLVDRLVFQKVRARFGGRLKYAISGGAALSPSVAEFIDAIGIAVYEGYGLTETSPIVSVNVPSARKVGSVGQAVPGVRVHIDPVTDGASPRLTPPSADVPSASPERGGASAEAKPAGQGKHERIEGEIVVYGPNVMQGYFKRPDENAAVFTPDGGLRTGDMGYVDSEGFLFITGRIKEQYKLENGKYVVPTVLEEQLRLSPYIANAMVYGDNKPYNVAVVVANVPAIRKWATEHQVTLPAEPEAAIADERVRSLVEREIQKYGSGFKGFESIQDFVLTASDFTIDNGMLTPKQSVKRRAVLQAYGGRLDQLYSRGRGEKRAPASAVARA
jgi:long-chain acyl-CoA synthetase